MDDQHPRCDSIPAHPTERRILTALYAQAKPSTETALKASPQQIQLMKLLQLPTTELEVRIKEELEANPALEEGAKTTGTRMIWRLQRSRAKPATTSILTITSMTRRRITG